MRSTDVTNVVELGIDNNFLWVYFHFRQRYDYKYEKSYWSAKLLWDHIVQIDNPLTITLWFLLAMYKMENGYG